MKLSKADRESMAKDNYEKAKSQPMINAKGLTHKQLEKEKHGYISRMSDRGKGDLSRIVNRTSYSEGYDMIRWHSKI